jgi:hypothetical protein
MYGVHVHAFCLSLAAGYQLANCRRIRSYDMAESPSAPAPASSRQSILFMTTNTWPVTMVRRSLHYLILLPLIARSQDAAPEDDNSAIVESSSSSCNCSGCPNSDRVSVGLHKDLVSHVCPEGFVATVTALRTANARGGLSNYDLLTWNEACT